MASDSKSIEISLIVCSRSAEPMPSLCENVQQTIGGNVSYEWIWIDNSNGFFSIHSAYNEGIRRSKGKFLVFIHEDLKFHTPDWGDKIIDLLSDSSVGIVGVIGFQVVGPMSDFRVWCPKSVGQVLQGCRLSQQPERYFCWHEAYWSKVESVDECCFVDGLFLSGRRDFFDNIKFDERIGGFHGYDFDICMQAWESKKKVVVCKELLIEHFSCGNYDIKFKDAMLYLHRKWQGLLPMMKGIPKIEVPKWNKVLSEHTKSRLNWIVQKHTAGEDAYEYWMLKNFLKNKKISRSLVIGAVKYYINNRNNRRKYRLKLLWKLIRYGYINPIESV